VKLLVQPEAGLAPLLLAMQRARQRIDIFIFRLDRKEVEAALADAVPRGVKVRALVAHTNRGGEARLRKIEQRLLEAGVAVARTADDLLKYHGKYLIIDDTLHLLGFNLTKRDVAKARSFGIQTRDRRAVRDAAALFERDLTRQPFTPPNGPSPLIVSPDNSRDALRRFVAGARRRLAIYDNRLEDPAFVKLIQQRVNAGVTVQIIGKARRLESLVPVRPLKPMRLHVRAIVRDGTAVFVGSQSLRRLELDARREVGLIIRNPAVARRLLQVFEQDWEESAPKKEKEKEKIDAGEDGAPAKETTNGKSRQPDEKAVLSA
jgi:phosphatidylserine/phosphatidylglycerophosphate/cardiolipin synthase-like enzyme